MALEIIHHGLLDVLENAALKQALTVCVTLNRMAIVVLPWTIQDQLLFHLLNYRADVTYRRC